MGVHSESGVPGVVATKVVSIGHRLFDGLSVAAATGVQLMLAAEAGVDEHAIAEMHPDMEVRCLEWVNPRREKWTSAHVGMISRLLMPASGALSGATIVPYAAHQDIPHGIATLGPTPEMRWALDDKRVSKRLFKALKLPVIDGFEETVTVDAMKRARRKFGYPFVLRAPAGSTGAAVFLVAGPHDARALLRKHAVSEPWLFERFTRGYSLNVNAVASDDEVAVMPPSVQIIGQRACSGRTFAYCGSDYAAIAKVPHEVVESVVMQARRVGAAMSASGYRGPFGLDFVVTPDNTVLPVEINPRHQNSTALLNFSLPPAETPARLHAGGDLRLGGRVPQAPDLSQVMVYSDESTRHVACAGVPSGIYRRNGSLWERVSRTFDPRQLRPGEVLAVGTVEHAGTAIDPGAALGRLIFRGPAIDLRLAGLRPQIADAIAWLRSATRLSSLNELAR